MKQAYAYEEHLYGEFSESQLLEFCHLKNSSVKIIVVGLAWVKSRFALAQAKEYIPVISDDRQPLASHLNEIKSNPIKRRHSK